MEIAMTSTCGGAVYLSGKLRCGRGPVVNFSFSCLLGYFMLFVGCWPRFIGFIASQALKRMDSSLARARLSRSIRRESGTRETSPWVALTDSNPDSA